MRIAIYSGSFNPVHNGHIAIAETAIKEGFNEVWMVVSPQNPHKKNDELWPFEERLKMVNLAIQGHPKIKANDCERNLPLPSYTINTLEFLQKSWPQHQFRLLIGGDNLEKFRMWKDHQKIIDQFGLVVYPRSTEMVNTLENHPNVSTIKAPLLNISSSEIREKLSGNQPIKDLVPKEIEEYLLKHLKNYGSGYPNL